MTESQPQRLSTDQIPPTINNDPLIPFSVKGFDEQIKNALQTTDLMKKKNAEYNLMKFKSNETSFNYINEILNISTIPESHVFALKILESCINNNWATFNRIQKDELRQYVINQVLLYANTDNFKETNLSKSIHLVLNKFNDILLEVVKKDYPKYLDNFIGDILSINIETDPLIFNNSLNLINNFVICLNKQESLFNTVRYELMINKIKLEATKIIIEVISFLMNNDKIQHRDLLIRSSFELLPNLIKYYEYNDIINIIMLSIPLISGIWCINIMEILIESISNLKEKINSFSKSFKEYYYEIHPNEELNLLINNSIEQFYKTLKEINGFLEKYFKKFNNITLKDAYYGLSNDEKRFILLICTIKKEILTFTCRYLELPDGDLEIQNSLYYLFEFFKVNEKDLNIVILDCFNELINLILIKGKDYKTIEIRNNNMKKLNNLLFNKQILRKIIDLICKDMPRPVEILITVDDNNNIIQERLTNTEYINYVNKYKNIIENIILLSYKNDVNNQYHNNSLKNIENSVLELLENQINKFDLKLFNSLIYTICSFSNLLPNELESNFYTSILKNLLNQADLHNIRINKAFVASNIIYVVGSFPKYLINNKNFVKIVLNKLSEFMNEDLEGIREMASDTFLNIFTNKYILYDVNYMKQLLEMSLNMNLNKLEFYQKRNVYKGIISLLSKIQPINSINKNNEIQYLVENVMETLFSMKFLTNNIVKDVIRNKEYESISYKESIHILKSLSLISEEFSLIMRLDFNILFNLLELNDLKMNNEVLSFIRHYIYNYIKNNKIYNKDEYIKNIIGSTLNLILNLFNTSPNIEMLKIISILLNEESNLYLGNKFEFETGLFHRIIKPIIRIETESIKKEKINDEFIKIYCEILSKFSNEFLISIIHNEIFEILLNEQLEILNTKNLLKVINRFTEIYKNQDFIIKILNNLLIILFDNDKESLFNELIPILTNLLKSSPSLIDYTRNELFIKFNCKDEIELFLKGILFINDLNILNKHFHDYKIIFESGILDEYYDLDKILLESRIN